MPKPNTNPPADPGAIDIALTTPEPGFQLTWVDNADTEDGYRIEVGPTMNGTFTVLGTTGPVGGGAGTFAASGLEYSTIYCFRVYAFNQYGDSQYVTTSGQTVGEAGIVVVPAFPYPPKATVSGQVFECPTCSAALCCKEGAYDSGQQVSAAYGGPVPGHEYGGRIYQGDGELVDYANKIELGYGNASPLNNQDCDVGFISGANQQVAVILTNVAGQDMIFNDAIEMGGYYAIDETTQFFIEFQGVDASGNPDGNVFASRSKDAKTSNWNTWDYGQDFMDNAITVKNGAQVALVFRWEDPALNHKLGNVLAAEAASFLWPVYGLKKNGTSDWAPCDVACFSIKYGIVLAP